MTEQEQQLLQAILRWENAEAPEAALILVKGIDRQLSRFHKKMLSHSLDFYRGERNDENRIELDSFIPYMREESHLGGSDLTDFLIMLAFYHFHPQQDDNYLEFNEPLGGFEPQMSRVRIQKLLKGCSINENGNPQLSLSSAIVHLTNANNAFKFNKFPKINGISFFLSLVGDCPADLSIDESLRRINITKLNVSDMGLLSITGLHQMTALTELWCSGNQLTTLDVSQNTELVKLSCHTNQLTTLDVSQNTELTVLVCWSNPLTTLDVSQNRALARLECSSNPLTTLDVSQNIELVKLDCTANQLTSLDVSQNRELTELDCEFNQLTTLDVSQNTALIALRCCYNHLSSEQKQQIKAQFPFAQL